jgi:hypothetical protein
VYRRVKFIQFVNTIRRYRRREQMARVFKAFRFDPRVYADFKELVAKSGYTMTSALEKFMADSLKFGLVFPSAKEEAAEAEARVMLSWLKGGKYWLNLGGKEETSTRGRLLQLLSKIEDADLRKDIEENLKQKA